ncbi:MAG TPA: TIGR01244 family sulfur transferase [Ramlibacter sp.]
MDSHPAAIAAEAIDKGVYVAAQLRPEDMPALAEAGLRSVINNRPDGEGGAGQPESAQLEAAARAAGLEYRYVPVPPAGHTAADAKRMSDAVDALPRPMLAFCRTGRRSAALYRMAKERE